MMVYVGELELLFATVYLLDNHTETCDISYGGQYRKMIHDAIIVEISNEHSEWKLKLEHAQSTNIEGLKICTSKYNLFDMMP